MRKGPGTHYPIEWVYKKRGLPVEVTAEFGNWRKIRDFSGTEGWVLHSLLSGRRSAITRSDGVVYSLYKGERAVLRFGRGVVVRVKECRRIQCEIEHSGTNGWVDKPLLWGVYDWEGNE